MFGIGKKQQQKGRMVWMIRNDQNGLYLGVCKDNLVHLKDPTACFRFADIHAAGVFLYWMVQRGELKDNIYRAVYAMVEDRENVK